MVASYMVSCNEPQKQTKVAGKKGVMHSPNFQKIAAKFDEYTMYHYKTTNRVTTNHKKSL